MGAWSSFSVDIELSNPPIGVIKGSEESLACPGRFLDEATYRCLSGRTNPTFSDQRERLYALFKAYCRLKEKNGHQDGADRTHTILRALLSGDPLKWSTIDYLYVEAFM